MGGKFLPRLDAQTVERHIIEPLWEELIFCLTEGFDLPMLLFDVAGIAQRDVHLFADGKRKLDITRVDIGQILIAESGTAQQVGRADASGRGLLSVGEQPARQTWAAMSFAGARGFLR